MDPREFEATVVLGLTPGIGSATLRRVYEHFGSAAEALAALVRLTSGGRRPPPDADGRSLVSGAIDARQLDAGRRAAEEAIAWRSGEDRHLLVAHGPGYPPALAAAEGAPPVLFVRGRADVLQGALVAVVGARRASHYGRDVARWFGAALADAGLPVVSGLALGVDGAAHEAALGVGGTTVAVFGTGIDRVYPPRHADLARRITNSGCLVSEFPLGTAARRAHFPRRNRVIAGLTRAVVVVEARARSGSLITARLAADAGREVFAVPGAVFSDQAVGCHALIRDGATLAATPEDVLEAFSAGEIKCRRPQPAGDAAPAGPDEAAVREALGAEAVSFDALLERTGLTPATLSSILTTLEMQGSVALEPEGRYRRRRGSPHTGTTPAEDRHR